MNTNLYAAWVGIFLGCVFGAIQGLFFHKENWLGGYGSWPRRMLRLGHISFMGIALINFAFAFTVFAMDIKDGVTLSSWLLIVGAVTMPTVCFASAFKPVFRHLFFIPALSVICGVWIFLWRILGR